MILIKNITTKFQPTNESDVINKAYLDEILKKIDGHISYIEKYFNEFKLQYNKQNVEDTLIEKAVKTTIQILYDKGLIDAFPNADKYCKIFYLLHDVDLIWRK